MTPRVPGSFARMTRGWRVSEPAGAWLGRTLARHGYVGGQVTDMWRARHGYWIRTLRVVESRIYRVGGGIGRGVEPFVGFGLALGCGVVFALGFAPWVRRRPETDRQHDGKHSRNGLLSFPKTRIRCIS